MSGSEVAAVVIAVVAGIAVILLVFAIVSLTRTLRSLRTTIDALHNEAVPALVEMRETVGVARAELERVDGLLATAESVSETVDSASRLAYLAASNPVIKTMAFATGTGRAMRRFRRRD